MTIRNLRWWIAALLLLASVINYVDRETLSILAPTIQSQLRLSDAGYAAVISGFLAAYTLSYLLSGRIADALGTRAGMAVFVGFWSIANMLTVFARAAWSLGVCRSLLGLGEAGGYTVSPKVVEEWFPPKDRGIAVGLYSVGGAIGATLAPVLVLPLALHFGWQAAFVATGALGLGFVFIWIVVFRAPQQHRWLSAAERAMILGHGRQPANAASPRLSEKERWTSILTSPAVWALTLARLLTDPVWYFFQFWMPKYLHTVRGFDQAALARLWLLYLAADIGFVGSGFLSNCFIRRGREPREARLQTMLVAAVLVPLAPLVAMSPTITGVFGISMIVLLAHTAWLASISTYVVDLVPKPILGSAFGFIAAGSAVGGILMNEAVPWVIEHFSYAYCFYAMVALHPLAYLLIRRFARRPWELPTAAAAPA